MESKSMLALIGSWMGSVFSVAMSFVTALHQLNALLATVAALGSIVATFWLIRSHYSASRKNDAEAELAIEHICQNCNSGRNTCPLPEHLQPKFCPRQRKTKH